jgi:hypothetical protein
LLEIIILMASNRLAFFFIFCIIILRVAQN